MFKFTKLDGTVILERDPNWVRYDNAAKSFVCCGYENAECVILYEEEEQIYYNIHTPRYPEFDIIEVEKV